VLGDAFHDGAALPYSTGHPNYNTVGQAATLTMAKYTVLDVLLGLWGVLSMLATGMAVVALVDIGAVVSAALAACRREEDVDCAEFRLMANEMLVWPARRSLALYIATLLVPFGYSIWRVRYSVPRRAPPSASAGTATVAQLGEL
jgi:hypothetical protein